MRCLLKLLIFNKFAKDLIETYEIAFDSVSIYYPNFHFCNSHNLKSIATVIRKIVWVTDHQEVYWPKLLHCTYHMPIDITQHELLLADFKQKKYQREGNIKFNLAWLVKQ